MQVLLQRSQSRTHIKRQLRNHNFKNHNEGDEHLQKVRDVSRSERYEIKEITLRYPNVQNVSIT